MDEAPLRRGQPSVHIKYGVNTGILSGDVMLIYAYEYLLQYADAHLAKALLSTFNKVAIEVCEGQQYDMNFETQEEVPLDLYLKMIELKTAALLGGAMKMGALIGGASNADAQHIEAFGRNIGIAFQLQDDILDTFGDPEKFGKKVGGDIAQNKKTYLVLKTLEVADAPTQTELRELMVRGSMAENEKIRKVTEIFERAGIRDLAEQKKEDYLSVAFEHLTKVAVAENRKAELVQLAHRLMVRMA
ncbi:MAG: polyprenyl synthetase family protein, partial [Bacteroidota bacterium]